jgi:N-acetylmuramoyl-L-alanine amidase
MKIILLAGHTNKLDKGATNLKTKENENGVVCFVISSVLEELKRITEVVICPFEFSLVQKIKWVNSIAKKEDVVLELHLNSSPKRKEEGAMCYYYGGSRGSMMKALKLIDSYCKSSGIKNCGILPDTSSRFGRLGIIRDTIGWSFLLELGSINNDVAKVTSKGGRGLIEAIKTICTKK